ncbi:uncharacterized protein DSM5745_08822 [Aspergillus mulundensis]|uniref:Aminoglycoside phosphotransferase domain-containing protein n=1 Tax=Aspergillus mulundensis TaxID=1810919 RepID=A0A3D8R4S1_9EURO|nr:hypothetical protein DSM5745_08822 [Aspergillus mulundensis]RDW69062.1 hypothetical protein DSM5745_08822 [Aspergillus mulundensis]
MSQVTYPNPEYPWVIDLPDDDPAVDPDWVRGETPESGTDSYIGAIIGDERYSDVISEISIDLNTNIYDVGYLEDLSTPNQEMVTVSDEELGCWIGPVVGWEEDREREIQDQNDEMELVVDTGLDSGALFEYDCNVDKSNIETHPEVMVVIPAYKPTDLDTESDTNMVLEIEDETHLDREIREAVAQNVSRGRYACSSLSKSHRSRLNYVYTGTLARPLDNGTKTVIIKHSVPYISTVKEHELTQARSISEGLVLNSLDQFSLRVTNTTLHNQIFKLNIRTPELYQLNYATHTLMMEHLKNSTDLQTFLLNLPCLKDERLWAWVFQIGESLGQWLRQFHNWMTKESQKTVAGEFDTDINKEMAGFRFRLSYEWLPRAIEKYPNILGKKKGTRKIMEKLMKVAREELDKDFQTKDETIGPIHGDFWAGNILLPLDILRPPAKKPSFDPCFDLEARNAPAFMPVPDSTILITDWEFAQYGPRALDIAQMAAELYIDYHIYGVEAAKEMIEGFIHGYDHITMEMSWRILLHVGTYFIVWAAAAGDGDREPSEEIARKKRKLVKLGRRLIVRGWRRRQKPFFGDFWNCVFRGYPD